MLTEEFQHSQKWWFLDTQKKSKAEIIYNKYAQEPPGCLLNLQIVSPYQERLDLVSLKLE